MDEFMCPVCGLVQEVPSASARLPVTLTCYRPKCQSKWIVHERGETDIVEIVTYRPSQENIESGRVPPTLDEFNAKFAHRVRLAVKEEA